MSERVIETVGLTKRYGDFAAVDGLDLTVEKGEVFGLLGPNGSGKTTTILMLLGLTEPSAGTVRVLGLDPARQPLSIKARVGYMAEQVGFYDELTARENLGYIAKLNGLPEREAQRRIDDLLARLGLAEVADKTVGTFSHGMRQRLGVADVLIKQPQMIIMDEPTSGLDPERAREFLELVRTLKADGITILLSSHLLYQVQAVCDRVGLFRKGRMVLEGTVRDLAVRVLGSAYRVYVQADGPSAALIQALQDGPGVSRVSRGDANRYELEAAADLRADAANAVVQAGGRLLALDVQAPSLDEIYTRYFQEVEHD
jgi:ABC-2 type transport system ATP-binding protein